MKKISSIVLALVLCIGLLAGCGASPEELKFSAPHNAKVSLSETQENVIKLDKLKESEEYPGQYNAQNKASFGGFNFLTPTYYFEDNQIKSIGYSYPDSNNLDVDKQKLVKYFTKIYGEPESKTSTYWKVSLANGSTYAISVDTRASDGWLNVDIRKK